MKHICPVCQKLYKKRRYMIAHVKNYHPAQYAIAVKHQDRRDQEAMNKAVRGDIDDGRDSKADISNAENTTQEPTSGTENGDSRGRTDNQNQDDTKGQGENEGGTMQGPEQLEVAPAREPSEPEPVPTETPTPEEDYECGDCGSKITKGAAECEFCGATLNWEGQ